MPPVTASSDDLSELYQLSINYPKGFSISPDRTMWCCIRNGKHGPADRKHQLVSILAHELIKRTLTIYPDGGRVRLRESILYKCGAGQSGEEPFIRIVSYALPRSA